MKLRNVSPLPGSLMLFSILGIFLSSVYLNSGRLSNQWGFTLLLVFIMVFIASTISMTYGPIAPQLKK